MLSDGRRRMFMRHKLFAKGTNGQPMINRSLINATELDPKDKAIDRNFERLLLLFSKGTEDEE